MRGTQPIVPSRAAMNRVEDFPLFACIVARTVRREVCERIHLLLENSTPRTSLVDFTSHLRENPLAVGTSNLFLSINDATNKYNRNKRAYGGKRYAYIIIAVAL